MASRIKALALSVAFAYGATLTYNAMKSDQDSFGDAVSDTNAAFMEAGRFVLKQSGIGAPSRDDRMSDQIEGELQPGFYKVDILGDGELNIRGTPGTRNPEIGTLENGSCIRIVGSPEERAQDYVPFEMPVRGLTDPMIAYVDRNFLTYLGPTRSSTCTAHFGPPTNG